MNRMVVKSTDDPQCLRALEQANRVRLARADLKRQIAGGELDAAEVLLACPWMAETMTVGELLSSQLHWGSRRCEKLLRAIPIAETKRLNELTERQRTRVADLLLARRAAGAGNGGRPAGAAAMSPREAAGIALARDLRRALSSQKETRAAV